MPTYKKQCAKKTELPHRAIICLMLLSMHGWCHVRAAGPALVTLSGWTLKMLDIWEGAKHTFCRVMATPQGTGAPMNLWPDTETDPMGFLKDTLGAFLMNGICAAASAKVAQLSCSQEDP